MQYFQMLFTYTLDACVFIYLSVAFDFEHTIKNFAISGLRLRVTINSLLLYLDFMLTGNP